MKNSLRSFAIVLATLSSPFALGDTLTLNDGRIIEGTITEETADNVFIEVNVTKSIKEERIIKLSDIANIVRTGRDSAEADALEKLVPTADGTTPDQYDEMLNKKVRPFLIKNKTSEHYDRVKKIEEILVDEKKKVEDGQVRFGSKWYTKEDMEQNRVDIDAGQALETAKALAQSGNLTGSLNLLEPFTTIYSSAESADDALKVRAQVLDALQTRAESDLATVDARLKQRTSDLDKLSAENRRVTEQARASEMAAAKARFDAESKNPAVVWKSYDPLNKSLLTSLKSQAQRAKSAKPVTNTLAEDYRQARAALIAGDVEKAEEHVQAVSRVKGAERYSEELDIALQDLKARTPEPAPAATETTSAALEPNPAGNMETSTEKTPAETNEQ